MVKIDFKFDARDLEQAILKAAAKAIVQRVENVRCPEHGQPAHIVASGSTTSNMTFKVSGCCKMLIQEVKAKLKG
jgi:hypothetical protein